MNTENHDFVNRDSDIPVGTDLNKVVPTGLYRYFNDSESKCHATETEVHNHSMIYMPFRWIPCDEKLPDVGMKVCAIDISGDKPEVVMAKYVGGFLAWRTESRMLTKNDITHWVYAPNIPNDFS